MPPKQKQSKKGPTYKPATPLKDMIPATVKQPPRQPKPFKVPESVPENQDKNAQVGNQIPILFEQWPSQQVVKAHDFGIASQVKFQDKSHESINQFLKQQIQNKDKMFNWKYLLEVQGLKDKMQKDQQNSDQQNQQRAKSSVNLENQKKNTSQNNIEQNKPKPMVVIETYLRQQTQQQMEKRKKQEAQKAQKAAKDKKKGKKQQVKQQGPLQVSDVKMSNIVVRKNMCPSGIWIGSQLQVIKIRDLRDVYNEEPVWKKIYPQQNGVPQITKSGKYWVKLYYMGKLVKVQVDDRIPLSHNTKQLFPKSQKNNEKWTLILTKAILKLIALSNPKANIVGSGLVINALTGMVTENIKIRSPQALHKLAAMMSDFHYTKKDVLVNCFNFSTKKQPPSNLISTKQQMKNIITLQNSTFKKVSNRRNSSIQLAGMKNIDESDQQQQKIEEHEVQSNLLSGYSYCIGDYFQNGQFNMVYSRDKNAKQQKLRFQYNDMNKIALGNKSRQQKLQHRKKKKQIKQKLFIQQKKRSQQIKKPIKKYHFIKLLADLVINCDYTNKQILIAKKCALNKLEYPPKYEIPNLQKQRQKQQEKQQPKLNATGLKFKEDAEVNPPIDDFSTVQNFKQILLRNQQGIWIKSQDMFTIFDEFQFFYNPNIFQFKSIEHVINKNAKQFALDQNKQILVVQKKGNPHLDQSQNDKEDTQKISLLFGFAFQQSKFDTLCDPYCMLQKFDFQSYRTASNVATLSQPLSCTYLTLNNNNSVFRIYTISKGKYAYWLSSDSKYKLLSVADYLTEFQAYTPKNFTIQYPPIDKKSYLTLSRLKIKYDGQQNNVLYLKLKNCPKDIQKYLVIRAVQIPEEGGVYTSQEQQGVIIKKQQSIHLAYQYSRVQLKPKKIYCLILEAYAAQSISEGSLQLLVLSKINTNFSIDQAEQIQPYKVVEKYNPNKYATILKERIFCNNNNNASILLKIFQGQEGQPVPTDKKASKKGGKDQPAFEVVQKQLAAKRLIHVKLFKNGNLIYYSKDYNQVILPNIQFEKTKQNISYYLQASFDLREWAGAAIPSDQTNKLYWSVQVTGQDAIAFVKDTLQQQKQKETRKSWQDKQPGRADKAKKARHKFLLQLKQEKGEALTQQQLQIINAPRLTKKKLLQQEKKNEDKKGTKGAKKDDKKGAKDKKQQAVQQKQEQRPVPKSQDNFMIQVKQFLSNLEQCKVTKIQLQEGQQPRIRSVQQQNSIKQGARMAKQNRAGQIVRNIEMRQNLKIKQKDKKDKLTILLEDLRSNFSVEWKKHLQWRTQDLEKDKVRQQKEKALIDIVNQQKPTISEADLSKIIGQYRNIEGANQKLADVVELIRKNIKIGNMIDKINTALQGWQTDVLKGIMEQIKNDKVEGINEQVMGKVNTMLQEAAKNPAIVAEKQAQIKKTKKPGKK